MGRIKKEKFYISDANYASILSRLYKIADELHIPFWLSFGTLLGLAQQQKRFEWDNDIDIGTTPEGFDALLANMDLIKEQGFFIRDKKREASCYRGMFIYDPKIQPFHVDISEMIPNGVDGRFTFRWLIRITPPAKIFNYLDKTLMTIAEVMNKNRRIPFKDSVEYKQLHKNKITSTLINIIAKADLYFTTKRELGMYIFGFAKIKYYGVDVLIPLPLNEYCAVNYGKNWTTPIKVRHTKGGSDCLKEKRDGIERCYID